LAPFPPLPWPLLEPALVAAWLAVKPLVVAAAVVAVDVPALPQSDWAAAETVSPCVGPGGVSCATPETYSPWLVTSAGQGGAVTALDEAGGP
jgi:hypothetical protein